MSAGAVMRCRLCDNASGNPGFTAREMMYGTRKPFDYFQCARCESLQIAQTPEAVGSYYPASYYGPGPQDAGVPIWAFTMLGGPVVSLLQLAQRRANHLERHIAERVAYCYLSGLGLTPRSRILDVGCGEGGLLRALKTLGYTALTGVDLFVDEQRIQACRAEGVDFVRGTILDLPRRPEWDLIMLHHSFEHMDNPREVMDAIAGLLAEGGHALIRMPVVPNQAWTRYGIHWVGLDAPRHLIIHSRRSVEQLAAASGLKLDRMLYDSTSFQFWASELYARDVPLHGEGAQRGFLGLAVGAVPDGLKGLAAYEAQARELNRRCEGDQAAFYLSRARGH